MYDTYILLYTVPAEDRNRTSPFPYGGHRYTEEEIYIYLIILFV
jgi:hypothetical protein